MNDQVRKHLGPEIRSLSKSDGCRYQPSVRHLEQIFVRQVFIGLLNYDRRLSRYPKRGIKVLKILVVVRNRIHVNFFAAEIVDLVQPCACWTGHDNLLDIRGNGNSEG